MGITFCRIFIEVRIWQFFIYRFTFNQDQTGHDVSLISKPLEGTQTVESYGLKHEDKLTAVFDGKLLYSMLFICEKVLLYKILNYIS